MSEYVPLERAHESPVEELLPHVAHVWIADLVSLDMPRMITALSDDELQKAARFKFVEDQEKFSSTRGLLRHILGELLRSPPHAIHFKIGRNGKPELVMNERAPNIRFNVTHTGLTALIACSLDREIGIDAEVIRDDFHFETVAATNFHPLEQRFLLSQDCDARRRAFYEIWTRKEAFVKAQGVGLSKDFRTFNTSTSMPFHLPQGEIFLNGFTIQNLCCADNCAAAVAVAGSSMPSILYHKFPAES